MGKAFLRSWWLYLGTAAVFAGPPLTPSLPAGWEYGLLFGTTNRGVALGGVLQGSPDRRVQWWVEGRVSDMMGEGEMPVYDPYTGYTYRTGEISLQFFTLQAGARYPLFRGQIANNIRPVLVGSVGPTIVFDPPESGSLLDRWRAAETSLVPSAFLGIGVDFFPSTASFASIALGLEFLRTAQKVHGRYDYGGPFVRLSFGRKK